MDSVAIPRGIRRDPSSAATPPRPDPTRYELTPVPATEAHYAARANSDRLAARIAANQVEQLDQLSLIGYSTSFDEQTRDVIETSLRLAARRVLES